MKIRIFILSFSILSILSIAAIRLCLGDVTVSFRQGTDSYSGCLDSKISDQNPTTNYNTTEDLEATWYAADNRTNSVIKFDISSIPSNATVVSSTLTINCSGINGTNTVSFKRLLRNWVIDEVTWNIYSTGNNWTTGGAAYDSSDSVDTISATLTISGEASEKYFTGDTLNSDIQGIISGTNANYGWVWFCETNNPGNFVTAHSADDGTEAYRPMLTITYSTAAVAAIQKRKAIIIQ